MPKTRSHVTVGQLNRSLGRGTLASQKAGAKPFRHTTSKGVSSKPAQYAPDRKAGQSLSTNPKGVPMSALPPDVSGGGFDTGRKKKIT